MKRIIGVSDMQVSNNHSDDLITYSLGSCIGVVIYDPEARTGGILHYMLPDSTIDPVKARTHPFMFADTGIPALFKAAYQLGAQKKRIRTIVVGGAQILDQNGFFNIGKRNHMALRKIFFRNQVMIDHEEVGGNVNRTVRIAIQTGDVYLKSPDKGERII